MSNEQTGETPKYLPRGVCFFQKAIKHRDNALKRDERERKRLRDRRLKDLKAEGKRQLLANIEEIDSELLARIDAMKEDQGVIWDCGEGPRGEALAELLYDHYLRQGLKVRVDLYSIVRSDFVSDEPTYYLRINIPEEAEYQKRGREAWQEGQRK